MSVRDAAGMRAFVILWSGQFISQVGSSLSAFALGVYVYRLTGSATTLGVVFALTLLPSILASPVGGPLVDRWGSRRSLLLTNIGSMLVTLALAVALGTHTFAVWQVYAAVGALSALSAVGFPAFASLAPNLVSKEQLGRANGLRMIGVAASKVLAPIAGGFLLLVIGISGIVVMDVASFGAAIGSLLLIRDRDGAPAAETTRGWTTLLSEFRTGWHYVASRRGLFALLLFIGAINFTAGFVDLLITPLVLSFASPAALGAVLTIGGVGMVATSLGMSVLGGPRHRIRAILVLSLVLALATIVGAARPAVALVAVAAFAFLGALGIIIATNQSVWQTKVEPGLLGRVMALQNMVANAPQLLAYLLAGPAVDRVFEPFVGRDRVHSPVLRLFVGDGAGRGIAALMMLTGFVLVLAVGLAAIYPRLRLLEDELPDVLSDDAAADAESIPDEMASSSSSGASMNRS